MYIVYYSGDETVGGGIAGKHYSLAGIETSLRYAVCPGDCVFLVPNTFDHNGYSTL